MIISFSKYSEWANMDAKVEEEVDRVCFVKN